MSGEASAAFWAWVEALREEHLKFSGFIPKEITALDAWRACWAQKDAELAALRAERDRDGELLDWLERNPRHESAPYFDDEAGAWGFPYEVSNAGGHGGGVGFRCFDSLRAAIDAAMRAERDDDEPKRTATRRRG